MNQYNIELTDMFGGELNYSFVKRFNTRAKSMRGAIQKVSRLTGSGYRLAIGDSEMSIYHSLSRLVGVSIKITDEPVGEEI